MEIKIMYAAAMFFAGWLWFFFFGRQLCWNIFTAYPLIAKMQKTDKDLIAPTSKSFTLISVLVCSLMIALGAFLVIRFCKLYLLISFFVGAALTLVMYINRFTPETRSNFEGFCFSYYRFVPDDELRTAMYNKKIPQMKLRLHDMGLPIDFIPAKFKN